MVRRGWTRRRSRREGGSELRRGTPDLMELMVMVMKVMGKVAWRRRGLGLSEVDNGRVVQGGDMACGGGSKRSRDARVVIGALAWASARLAMGLFPFFFLSSLALSRQRQCPGLLYQLCADLLSVYEQQPKN